MIDRNEKEFTVRGGRGPGEVSDVHARFVQPGAGMFGRDRAVPVSEATEAVVSYTRDGRRVQGQRMSATEAIALLEEALQHQQAETGRAEAQRQAWAADQQAVQQRLANLTCLVCGGGQFDAQISREDSQWGMSTFKLRSMICLRCGFVMQFSLGRSYFVPG